MGINYIKLAELSYIHIIDGDRGKNYPSTGDLMSSGFCLFLNAGNVTEKGFVFNELKYITKKKCFQYLNIIIYIIEYNIVGV